LISSLDGAAETADDNNVRTDSEMYVIAHNIMDAGLDPSEQAQYIGEPNRDHRSTLDLLQQTSARSRTDEKCPCGPVFATGLFWHTPHHLWQ
jgi:hypothetical protein